MALSVSVSVERWPVAGSFVISRGTKTHVDIVKCEIEDGGYIGAAEATPIYYEGESAEQCAEEITQFVAKHPAPDRSVLLHHMRRGAARNALDCALWDLERRKKDKPLWQIAELPNPKPLATAFTISLGQPEIMEAQAHQAALDGHGLLKLKLSGQSDHERVAAVHRGAPNARLIVDANESWNDLDIAAEAERLKKFGVELIEQPVSAGHDHLISGVNSPVPLCADESCHTSADVERLAPFYDAVNIKLDKAGGLTEAMAIAHAAQAMNMKIMVGCMLSTSLGIRPAFALAQLAQWIDLDGPLLLAKDRDERFEFEAGHILPPDNGD
ncbi:MAG: N-acetyl-D-Glu racemase DgcA [Parasphingorhabdus sp.]|uniref:N-acetyl-D-Glu racemase DgcA n=1 Tax=Parasphingorhabdus sp. TaxID=2709688 RepID=UPI003263596C